MKLLKIHSKKKFQTSLSFAPAIMSRHRQNLSFYYMKNKNLFFTVEVKIFYKINEKNRFKSIIIEPPVNERK